jgi:hypothetical protein
MTKVIGTSFSMCLRSVARGDVAIEDIVFIMTNTAYPSREAMIEFMRQVMAGKDTEKHIENACILWDSGRIFQPSFRPEGRRVKDGKMWIPFEEMFEYRD